MADTETGLAGNEIGTFSRPADSVPAIPAPRLAPNAAVFVALWNDQVPKSSWNGTVKFITYTMNPPSGDAVLWTQRQEGPNPGFKSEVQHGVAVGVQGRGLAMRRCASLTLFALKFDAEAVTPVHWARAYPKPSNVTGFMPRLRW